jgi:hypothetical protein
MGNYGGTGASAYNAKNVEDLFKVYTGALPSVSINGTTWTKYGTGTAFDGFSPTAPADPNAPLINPGALFRPSR